VVAATTVASQDIWLYVMTLLFCCIVANVMVSALAQAQLVQVLSQVLAVVSVPLVVDLAVDLLPVEVLLPVDHVLPHVTSVVGQTTLPVIARLRL